MPSSAPHHGDDFDAARPSVVRGASVVAFSRHGVLMVCRARPPFQGRWSFPGGRAKAGESAEATARRELAEETGLHVGEMLQLGQFRPAATLPPVEITVLAARLDHADLAHGPIAGDDAAAAAIVPFDQVLNRPLTAGAVGWIARALLATTDLPSDPARLAGAGLL